MRLGRIENKGEEVGVTYFNAPDPESVEDVEFADAQFKREQVVVIGHKGFQSRQRVSVVYSGRLLFGAHRTHSSVAASRLTSRFPIKIYRNFPTPRRRGTIIFVDAEVRRITMGEITLESLAKRVEALEAAMAAKGLSGRTKDWHKVVGMFQDSEFMRKVDEECLRAREREREAAPQARKGRNDSH